MSRDIAAAGLIVQVAFMHISSTYSLHPDVRTKRGGKAEVKEPVLHVHI